MFALLPQLLFFAVWLAFCRAKPASETESDVVQPLIYPSYVEEDAEVINTITITVRASTCSGETTPAGSPSRSSPDQPVTITQISTVGGSIIISTADTSFAASQAATTIQLITTVGTLILPASEASIFDQKSSLHDRSDMCRSGSCLTTAANLITALSALTGPYGGFNTLNGTETTPACVVTITTYVTLPQTFTGPIVSFSTLSGTATDNPCVVVITTFVTLSPTFAGPIGGFNMLFDTAELSTSTVQNPRAREIGILPIPTSIRQLSAAHNTRLSLSQRYREKPIRSVGQKYYNLPTRVHEFLPQHDPRVSTPTVRQLETAPSQPAGHPLPVYAVILIVLACVVVVFAFFIALARATGPR